MPDLFPISEAFVSTAEFAGAVAHKLKDGRLRKIGSRLYTRNMTDRPELIVQRKPVAAGWGLHARRSNRRSYSA